MRHRASDVIVKWTLAGAGVAFGLLLAELCDKFEVDAPYLPFLPGIIVSLLLGGFKLGAAATLASGICVRFFFLKPCYSLTLPAAADTLHLLLFFAVAFVICYAINMLMRSNAALSRDNFVLGHKIFLLLRERRDERHDERAPLIPTSLPR